MTIAVSALATVARATPTFSGSRSTSSPGQLVTDDDWSTSHGGFKIDFTVDFDGSYWSYDYHFYDADGSDLDPRITRFLKLQVSDVPGAWFKLISDGHTPGYSSGDLIDLEPFDISFHLWDAPPTDPTYGFFGLFVGDDNDNTTDELSDSHVTFISSQGPTWGSFYARDGDASSEGGVGPAEAVNRGFDEGDIPNPGGGTLSHIGPPPAFDPFQSPNDSDVKSWILVPDTYAVPEPASVVLAGQIVVIGLLMFNRLRKRNCS